MKLEEAKKVLESYINAIDTFGTIDYKCINNLYNPIKTVLQALENSIPKEVYIKEKEKNNNAIKYCKSKSKFQTFGDEQLERTLENYINRTKNEILELLEGK